MARVFAQVAEPVASLGTIGAFFGTWRLMSVDGMEWDVPDTAANREAFGSRGGSEGPGAYPKVRVVTVSECASHAAMLAVTGPAAGGKGCGEQSLARKLLRRDGAPSSGLGLKLGVHLLEPVLGVSEEDQPEHRAAVLRGRQRRIRAQLIGGGPKGAAHARQLVSFHTPPTLDHDVRLSLGRRFRAGD